jgi:hypothetical protein
MKMQNYLLIQLFHKINNNKHQKNQKMNKQTKK